MSYWNKNIKQLKQELDSRGLDQYGVKEELIMRLEDNDMYEEYNTPLLNLIEEAKKEMDMDIDK
jgi:hypothetical protein